MRDIIPSRNFLYGYADDHALRISYNPSKENEERKCMSDIENCVININIKNGWMPTGLKLIAPKRNSYCLVAPNGCKCLLQIQSMYPEVWSKTSEIKYLIGSVDL